MYGNIRLKEKTTLNSFEQSYENYISLGFFGSAQCSQIPNRHDSSADRHTCPFWLVPVKVPINFSIRVETILKRIIFQNN